MQLLRDKIIFVTGGSRGIGFECAKKYIEAGAIVVVVTNDVASMEECRPVFGEPHSLLYCEVSDGGQVEKVMKFMLNKYGRIDAIHNNAGIARPSKPLHHTSDEEWDDLFNVNLKGILYTTKFGIEALMESKGCILNTSSLVGDIGQENHAVYAATKGGVNALTKSMALDYAKYKVRVNSVAPAGVWTPLLEEWGREQDNVAEIKNYLDNIHALGYCPDSETIADVCVFLLSDKARFITGVIMPVSGGAELGYRRMNELFVV